MRNTTLTFGVALAILAPHSMAQAETIYGLTSTNSIVTFNSSSPDTIKSSGSLNGIGADTLLGLDLRPADRLLYSIGASGNLYRITKDAIGSDYTATSVGVLTTSLDGAAFGFDFNPTVDRLRIVSDTNQNLRVNPNDPTLIGPPAGTIVDGMITLNGSSNVDLVGAGYRNNLAGAMVTTLFGLDALTDSLVRSTNANAGTYTNTNASGVMFGPLGLSFSTNDRVGFDISGPTDQGYISLNDGFYKVDQTTGASTFVGALGARGVVAISAAAVPEPATWAMMIIGFGAVGAAVRGERRRRVVAIA